MTLRLISFRSPYKRGGLSFDSSCPRVADGRAYIDLTEAEAEKLGEANGRELLLDPAISWEIIGEERPWLDGLAERLDAVVQARKPATVNRPPAPKWSRAKRKPAASKAS